MTAYRTLINVQSARQVIEVGNAVVVDCRFELLNTEAGRAQYQAEHIPGAYYAHLDDDLSAIGAAPGRHPLPNPQAFAETLAGWGVKDGMQVIAYDQDSGATASRLWWMLGWISADTVPCAVLDGGLAAWREAGFSLDSETPPLRQGAFHARPDANRWVDERAVANREALLVDARTPTRFRGEHEPIDPVAGHIPGAINLPFGDNLGDGRFLDPAELTSRFESAFGTVSSAMTWHMCGSGVTACHNLLAMAHAGLAPGRLYVGSWSGWIDDPNRPIATGDK